MGVYIKGMEMPKSCGDCKAFVCYRQWAGDVGDCFCGITKNDAKAKEKNADCPLVPVPEHGDLIDRDALIKELEITEEDDHNGATLLMAVFLEVLKSAPTIIPAEENNNDR